jgi:pyrroline-5-carboxylate reductase
LRVGIIGAGKIGTAIIKGLQKCSHVTIDNIIASGRSDETIEKVHALGATGTKDNEYLVNNSDSIFISVKPYHFPKVFNAVNRGSWRGKTVISVMAGVKLETLKELLPEAKIFRAMPNINAVVQESTTAVAFAGEVTDKDLKVVEGLLRCVGSVKWVPEEYLDIWTGLIGSGPAFLSEIIDGLVLGAVATGMPRELAYLAVLHMMKGTVELLRVSEGKHPMELRDEVTTPAGTTIAGLKKLERTGVKAGLMEVVEAAVIRSREIGVEIDNAVKGMIFSKSKD